MVYVLLGIIIINGITFFHGERTTDPEYCYPTFWTEWDLYEVVLHSSSSSSVMGNIIMLL